MAKAVIATMVSAVLALTASAQQPGPALSIDAGANRHAISPDIYGINFYWGVGAANDPQRAAKLAAAADIRATARRWRGNGTSTYRWKFDVNNIDADWFFETLPDTRGECIQTAGWIFVQRVRGLGAHERRQDRRHDSDSRLAA